MVAVGKRLYLRLDNGPLEPAEFAARQTFDGGTAYSVCCPACGHVSALPDTHTVQRGGNVTPIWVCASEACPYADYLTFELEVT